MTKSLDEKSRIGSAGKNSFEVRGWGSLFSIHWVHFVERRSDDRTVPNNVPPNHTAFSGNSIQMMSYMARNYEKALLASVDPFHRLLFLARVKTCLWKFLWPWLWILCRHQPHCLNPPPEGVQRFPTGIRCLFLPILFETESSFILKETPEKTNQSHLRLKIEIENIRELFWVWRVFHWRLKSFIRLWNFYILMELPHSNQFRWNFDFLNRKIHRNRDITKPPILDSTIASVFFFAIR